MIGVGFILALLFGLLTLVSYVDRLYQEIGKFLSRDFQDNIDAFEQIVEPRLGVTRTRASITSPKRAKAATALSATTMSIRTIATPASLNISSLERLRSPRSHAQPRPHHHCF